MGHWLHAHNTVLCINPLFAKFFRLNINIYLYFVSFLHTNKTQVVEIPPRVLELELELELIYFTKEYGAM